MSDRAKVKAFGAFTGRAAAVKRDDVSRAEKRRQVDQGGRVEALRQPKGGQR